MNLKNIDYWIEDCLNDCGNYCNTHFFRQRQSLPYYCEGPCQARTYCKAESLTLASTFSIWKIHLVFLQDCCSLLNGELNSSCHEFCHEITKSILQHFLEEIFLCFLVSSKGPSQLHFLFLFALFFGLSLCPMINYF